jgi:hypothetical protein
MYFIFLLEKDINRKTFCIEEGPGFKPIQYYLKHFSKDWSKCSIYCDDDLLFILRHYTNRTHVSRYEKDMEILSCTLINGQLDGFAFLYERGSMAYILRYDHNNLNGKQGMLIDKYSAVAKSGQFVDNENRTERGDRHILFAHEMVLALVKWY